MGKNLLAFVAAIAAIAGLASNAAAETARTGASVKIDGGHGGVFAAGGNVEITGEVEAGLSPWTGVSAAGGSVNVSASVDGALFLAGGNVDFSGRSKALFAMGGDVTVSGEVEEEAHIAGANVVIAPGAAFEDDVTAGGATVDFGGAAHGDARLTGAFVRLNGVVDGDVDLAGDEVVIGPEARVKGDLSITSTQKVDIPDGAQIDGEVVYKKASAHEFDTKRWEKRSLSPGGLLASSAFGALFWVVALGASGVLMSLLFPRWFGEAARIGRDNALTTMLIGVAVLIATPVFAIILMATILGLPFGGFLFALYFGLLSISMIGAGLGTGHLLFDRSKDERAKIGLYLAGLAIVLVLGAVPLLGAIVTAIAFPFGLGVMARSGWTTLRAAQS